jgi:predicted amino acid dehydrogenase
VADTVESLQAALDALNAARAGGVQTITYVGGGSSRTVIYKTDCEMNAAVQDLQRRIAELTSGGRRTIHLATSKGLDHRDDRD